VAVRAVQNVFTAGDGFLSQHAGIAALPHMLVLLIRAVQLHCSIHPSVLRLISVALPVAVDITPELTRALLRLLLEVLLCGSPSEALEVATQWATGSDPTLVGSFVLQARSRDACVCLQNISQASSCRVPAIHNFGAPRALAASMCRSHPFGLRTNAQ
jgi:hypothetical protein